MHSLNKNYIIVPPPPARFSINEWHRNNNFRNRTCLDQQILADRILAECARIKDKVEEITVLNKREVDQQLAQKLNDIEFNQTEIETQRKEVCIEIENLNMYMERIKDALKSLREQAEKLCKQCIVLRENRLGIDLCYDNVEAELRKELQVIRGSQNLLDCVLVQANEQVRLLRSTIYFMDRDLEDKGNVFKIDSHNASLKETSLNLSMYHGFSPLDPSNISLEEWNEFTKQNIEKAAKEINGARQLRSYVDTLLRQVIEDLWNQFHACNEAFRRRIEEIKGSKSRMEIQHAEIVRQANEITRTITELHKTLAEKESYMALAHTRLGNRAQRPGVELCKDNVEHGLVVEVRQLRGNAALLQHMLSEAQASLRYLLKTQCQLEEDINIKTNTLKIDEVDCMTLRQSMDYHAY